MALSTEQLNFIKKVAVEGTPRLAAEKAKVDYGQIMVWNRDKEFALEVKRAQEWCINSLNQGIVLAAKKELFKILISGIVEITTHYTTERDVEGVVVKEISRISKRHMGVPLAAIKMGLDLMPEIQRAIESLIANNALPGYNLERLQEVTTIYEVGLQEALTGTKTEQLPEDYIIAQIQKTLVGGSQ